MRRVLGIYQYLGPLVLFPASYWLWWRCSRQDHRAVVLTLSMPILFSYVIPGIGTNVLHLWEFHTRFRLGRFRAHHGFVFGSATSVFALICLVPGTGGFSVLACLRAGFVLGSVLAFWNWLYDIAAIDAGLMTVYNRPFSRGQGAAAIATDYAPVIFGSFGLCYGMAVYSCRFILLERGQWELFYWLFAVCNLAVVLLPVGAFVLGSYLRTGTSGLTPCPGPSTNGGREQSGDSKQLSGKGLSNNRAQRHD